MSVNSQTPLNQYIGNGLTTEFTYEFHILEQEQMGVFLAGGNTAETSGYTVSGVGDPEGGTVTFETAPVDGVLVRLERRTPLTRTTDFIEGGEIGANTLNHDGDKLTHIAQEIDRRAFQEDPDGTLNANNRRLKNLADPIDNQDAATKVWVNTSSSSTLADAIDAKEAAEEAQAAAEQAQTNAETAQTNAETAEANAELAQAAAEQAQLAAEQAETNAETAQANAEIAETNAETAQANAEAAVLEAENIKNLTATFHALTAAYAAQTANDASKASDSADEAAASAAAIANTLAYKGTWPQGSPVTGYPENPETGHLYKVIVATSFNGVDYEVGDSIIYNGTGSPGIWDRVPGGSDAFLIATNNLSELTDVVDARTNLGVYSTAQVDALAGSGLVKTTAETISGQWTFTNRVDIDDGKALRIHDSGDTDYAQFSHDGTDFNTSFVNTAEWNVGSVLNLTATGSTTLKLNRIDSDANLNIELTHTGGTRYFGIDDEFNLLYGSSADLSSSGNKIWHEGNDGTGSGLDADTLDGNEGSAFAKVTDNQTVSGAWTFSSLATFSGADTAPSAGSSRLSANMLHIDGKEAIDGADGFLRLNQNGDFTSGVYTPGNFRADGTVNFRGPLTFSGASAGDVILAVDGTASAPAYSFEDDSNTGMYTSGENTIAWACGGTQRMVLSSGGALTCDGDVAGNSDIRLKKNLQLIPNALTKVNTVSGYTFDRTDIAGRHTGVVAQEIEAILPEAVHVNEQTGIKAVAYGNLAGLLIEAIKELTERVERLER